MARRTMADAFADGRRAALEDAEAALVATFIATVSELPLSDLDPEDARDILEPMLADLAANLDALTALEVPA